jgi:hypothetical protein
MEPAAQHEIQSDDFAFVYLDVDDPVIAWLVYRAAINSCDIATANPGNISWFLMDVIRRGLISTLRREGVLEGFRLKEFPSNISRLRCVYAYPTLEIAQRGNYGRGKFRLDNLVAIAPASTPYRISEYDSNWITDFDSLPLETARKYWSGETTKNPLTECLLSGRFWIYGTAVRARAYETIKRTWPNSLAMLELSRLAAEFGSDLGSVAPWLKRNGDQIMVSSVIRYSESEGQVIIRQAVEQRKRDPTYPINMADLEPLWNTKADPTLDQKFSVPKIEDYPLRDDKVAELNEFVQIVLRDA